MTLAAALLRAESAKCEAFCASPRSSSKLCCDRRRCASVVMSMATYHEVLMWKVREWKGRKDSRKIPADKGMLDFMHGYSRPQEVFWFLQKNSGILSLMAAHGCSRYFITFCYIFQRSSLGTSISHGQVKWPHPPNAFQWRRSVVLGVPPQHLQLPQISEWSNQFPTSTAPW